MRIIGRFFLLFLINEITSAEDLSCEVQIRQDPFDIGFQKVKTYTVFCELKDTVHITEPTILSNAVNENVTHLVISNNKNIEFLPQDIGTQFQNLRYINAYDCSIKSINKHNFKGLTKMVNINLEKNNLETIGENSFDDMVDLAYLNLDDNKLTNLPSKIFEKLENLDGLYLKSNQLTNLDEDLLKHNKKIALLHLNDNKLKTLPSGIFDGLTLMRQLWLRNNEIENLPPHIFDDCGSLINLDLSRNKIKNINTNWLSMLKVLREISFSFNPLDFIDLTIFDNNEYLSDFFFNGVATKDIRNIQKVDNMKNIKGIGLYDTCVDGQFHEGNLDKLKQAVRKRCIV